MSVDQIHEVLGWCTVINFGILVFGGLCLCSLTTLYTSYTVDGIKFP